MKEGFQGALCDQSTKILKSINEALSQTLLIGVGGVMSKSDFE